jgi:hypothetical protein
MAKSQTVRSTIKNDPFETLIPDRISERTNAEPTTEDEPKGVVTPIRPEPEPKAVEGHKKEKLTVHLTHDLIERVKNAAYWNPRLTIASIAELGIKYAIEQVEKEHGGPYPPRESELKGGRPIGS